MKTIKNKCRFVLLTGLITILFSTLPYFVLAQDPGPCPDCPIDGGLILLLAAGLGYGMKKYTHRAKMKEEKS